MKRSEAKKLTMESSGDPVDWMIQEVMASFFTHSLLANGFLRMALHEERSIDCAPRTAFYQ